ncbi:uncharacterized protein [Euwallacea similis]|uniref:uncharacterized protein n=1 Tax=Euwallacea similis TaxID=1736056 RepID=UPI00344B3762
MVKAEVATSLKTPNKRKSLANNTPKVKQENESPAKKIKTENGKTLNKAFTPKKPQNQSPKNNLQASAQKSNKKNKQKQSPKPNLKPFAGTKQLNDKQKAKVQKAPKPKPGNDKETSKGQRKRKNMFYNLVVEVKTNAGSKDPEILKKIQEKVKAISGRSEELTKTAKKKLGILRRLQITLEEGIEAAREHGKAEHLKQKEESQKLKATKKEQKTAAQKGQTQPKSKQPAKAKQQPKPLVAKPKVDSDDDVEDDDDDDDSDAGELEEDSNDEVEVEEDDDDEADNASDDDEAEDGTDDDDDDEEEDEDSDEEEVPAPKEKPDASPSKNKQPTIEDLKKKDLVKKGQKRFVLFVGNIPYDTTKQDLSLHFSKVGNIVDVRIPTDKGSNKPRGFAYVEVKDEIAYEKCLSMHQSHIKGRRINVLYTQGGKKKGDDRKKEIKAKNMKLHAMRRKGQLAGSTKQSQKRSFRRNKSKKNTGSGES